MSGLPIIRTRYRPKRARTPAVAAVYLVVPIALAALLIARVHGITAEVQPRSRRAAVPSASFVRLTDEQSAAAMSRVRTSWQLERGGPVSVEFDPADAAFACAVRPAAPVSVQPPRMPAPSYSDGLPGGFGANPLAPPSKAAPPPEELAADYAPLSTEVLFPRTELLKFDGLSPFKKGTRR